MKRIHIQRSHSSFKSAKAMNQDARERITMMVTLGLRPISTRLKAAISQVAKKQSEKNATH